jgi:hypothetical protein
MKQPRPLTDWELSQLQGMRNMSLEERIKAQQNGAAAISIDELKNKQIEDATKAMNHLWPWQEK